MYTGERSKLILQGLRSLDDGADFFSALYLSVSIFESIFMDSRRTGDEFDRDPLPVKLDYIKFLMIKRHKNMLDELTKDGTNLDCVLKPFLLSNFAICENSTAILMWWELQLYFGFFDDQDIKSTTGYLSFFHLTQIWLLIEAMNSITLKKLLKVHSDSDDPVNAEKLIEGLKTSVSRILSGDRNQLLLGLSSFVFGLSERSYLWEDFLVTQNEMLPMKEAISKFNKIMGVFITKSSITSRMVKEVVLDFFSRKQEMRQIVDANMEEDRVETEQTIGDIDLEDAINLYSYEETERNRFPDNMDSERTKEKLRLKFAHIYFLHLNGIYDPCDDV